MPNLSRTRLALIAGFVAVVALAAIFRGFWADGPGDTPSTTGSTLSGGTLAPGTTSTTAVPGLEIFVDAAHGDDQADGTREAPFRTLDRAREAARSATGSMDGDVVVVLRGGIYALSETFRLTPADSGAGGFDTVYRSEEGEDAIIEGGIELDGWERTGDLYTVPVPDSVPGFRQFYAADVRQPRARSATAEGRALGFAKEEILGAERDGAVIVPRDLIRRFEHPEDLELLYVGTLISGHGILDPRGTEAVRASWRSHRLEVESVTPAGEGSMRLEIAGDALYHASERGFWRTFIAPIDPFYLENAFELLDEPGEWFFDERDRRLYWWPPAGVVPDDVETWIPAVETLLDIDGTPSDPVHDIRIEGLTFRDSTYLLPNEVGYVPGQGAGLFVGWEPDDWMEVDGVRHPYLDRPIPQGLAGAAIEMDSVHGLTFTENVLTHLGSDGILMHNDVVDATVSRNTFTDISGGALVAGHEVHEVIDEPMERLIERVDLADNVFESTGREYFSSAGVQIYKSADFVIEHNEFRDMPWSGLSLGWGFANNPDSFVHVRNRVLGNRFEDTVNTLYDGGAIYLLGPSGAADSPDSDRTVVEGNVIAFSGIQPKLPGDTVDPAFVKRAGIQLDEGNRNVSIDRNVVLGAPTWLQVTEWQARRDEPGWIDGLRLSGSGNWTDGSPSVPRDLELVGIAAPLETGSVEEMAVEAAAGPR